MRIMTSDISKLAIVLPKQHNAKPRRRGEQKDVFKRIKLLMSTIWLLFRSASYFFTVFAQVIVEDQAIVCFMRRQPAELREL